MRKPHTTQSRSGSLPAEKAHLAKKSRSNQKVKHFKKEAGTKIRLVIAKGEGGEMNKSGSLGLVNANWYTKNG